MVEGERGRESKITMVRHYHVTGDARANKSMKVLAYIVVGHAEKALGLWLAFDTHKNGPKQWSVGSDTSR